ncbi:MAG: hypothetical protein ACFFBE_12595 [Promethearchaeota archaeon]
MLEIPNWGNINKYLSEDEKILWYRIELVNLVYFIRAIVIFIVISLVMCPFINILFFQKQARITIGIMMLVMGIIDMVLIALAGYNYKLRKRRLHLEYKQLKNYEQFDIITNKRYIRRHYYLNYKVDLSRYIFEHYIEKIDDIIFLKLENIKSVIVAHQIKEINFILEDEPSMFSIKALEMSFEDFNEALKILKQILNLDILEQDRQYEKYIRKK